MPRISRGIARNEVIPLSPPGWRDIVIPLPVGVRFLKAWLIFSQAPLNSFGGLWLVEQFPHICIHSWSDLAQICWMNSILDIHASPVYHASRYSCSFGASCLFSRAISMFLQTNCLSNRGKIWWQISLWDSPGLVTFWQRCVEFRPFAGLWLVEHFPCICWPVAERTEPKFCGQTHDGTPHAMITFGHFPWNFHCFPASDLSRSLDAIAGETLFGLSSKLVG